ncbi:MAG: 23S rRNA (adenine(2503)-C(2))-methyltransferase RlmN [Bacteroidales bacterium]|jgi:23S rRNA (adenine2503-C2)-methyltransferase|nr:23S rRNA (adenine(2503)-C(2))-methyltransferase RlmN [Bacteroidales bacterium]
MQKESLYGKTLDELISVTKRMGFPGFVARQIADWLYRKKISSIDEMTNLSKKSRDMLAAEYDYGIYSPDNFSESVDGTKKYVYKVLDGKYVETAYIPDSDRAAICISSQSGCKMRCTFCMTGKQGFQGNLTSREILNQFRSLPEHDSLTNVVFMGMGEPLDNLREVLKCLGILTGEWGYGWSPSRITVSTAGLLAPLQEFLEKTRVHLAISLNSPFDEERRTMMPVQQTNAIKDILDIIRNFEFGGQRRVSFEYILFRGVNDSLRHVRELSRILNGIKCRVNIIRFHEFPGSEFKSPGLTETVAFRDALNAKGILATIRTSRGADIKAACGLLSTLKLNRL